MSKINKAHGFNISLFYNQLDTITFFFIETSNKPRKEKKMLECLFVLS